MSNTCSFRRAAHRQVWRRDLHATLRIWPDRRRGGAGLWRIAHPHLPRSVSGVCLGDARDVLLHGRGQRRHVPPVSRDLLALAALGGRGHRLHGRHRGLRPVPLFDAHRPGQVRLRHGEALLHWLDGLLRHCHGDQPVVLHAQRRGETIMSALHNERYIRQAACGASLFRVFPGW